MNHRGITVVGSLNHDVRLSVHQLPHSGETITSDALHRSPGGKGANQAAASARLGRAVAMIGAVGDDDAGRDITHRLVSEGVGTAGIDVVNDSTGMAVVLWEQPESTIIIAPGANAWVTGDRVQAHAEEIRRAGAVLCQLETPLSALEAVANLAAGIALLNPAPSAGVPLDLLRRFDVVVPNRFELSALTGAREAPRSVAEVRAMAESLGHPAVVITLGADGCLVVQGNQSAAEKRSAAVHVRSVDVRAVDTTGAGDSFCAGLADALLDGADLADAARWATQVAASTTTRHGALDSLPTRAELPSPAHLRSHT